MRVEVAASWAVRPNESSGLRGRKGFSFFVLSVFKPCFGIGLSLSLIYI